MSVAAERERIYGVDFSGAQDAGDGTWIASAVRLEDALFVEGCFPASSLPDSGPDRDAALPALRSFLAAADDAVVGLDFPFGVPAEVTDEARWRAFLEGFPEGADGPEEWADACRERAEALDRDRVELKRGTDEAAGAPWSPYNLRMRAATFYGLSEVLEPLVAWDAVSVLPMQTPNPGRPWLVEACPAVTLDRLGIDASASEYKDGEDAAEHREELLAVLEADHDLVLAPGAREAAIEGSGGDAIDAVVAALGVARAMERGDPVAPGTVGSRARLEGLIYG